MISTLISLFAAGILMGSDLPPDTAPQSMPVNNWHDSALLTATSIPTKNPEFIAPVIKAKSAIAVDLSNGLILYEKNIYEPLPIASLTKLMTAVIILEENNINDVVTVSSHAAKTEGTKIWLAPGEKITVENLLDAMLISSANDAAAALAEYNSKTGDDFVTKMNIKSKELGLFSTHFNNPTGLDSFGTAPLSGGDESNSSLNVNNSDQSADQTQNDNISTAYDLTLLARYAYGKSFVRRTTVKKELEISSVDEKLTHKLKNTDDLLGSYLKVLGLKTGTTDQAGECLISIIEDDKGHDILTVILNSPSRYTEAKILADWVFRAYTWS